ncbi:MAG TPA: hypothetical protein DF613_16100 [Lachnospiraceae bacterium]|nr:hypothetical protein [Lachnospiraceae bacterium]
MKAKKIIQRSCFTLMLMMAMLFAMSIAVSAETVPVTGLTQTGATKSTATVKWDASASGYLVYVNGQFVTRQTGTSYKVSGLAAGNRAEVVIIGYNNETLEADEASIYNFAMQGVYGTGIAIYAYSTPGKPGNVANSSSSTTFDWNPKSSNAVKVGWTLNAKDTYAADGWQVVVSTVDGKKKLKTLTVAGTNSRTVSTSFNIKSVKNRGFSVKVRGYITLNSKNQYGVWSASKVVIPQAATNMKLSSKNRSATIKWKKIANATKYEVYLCKDASVSNPKFKKVKTLSAGKTSYTISKIPLYKRYGIYVKAVVKYGKKSYKSVAAYYDTAYFSYA